ncbi:MAG: hypothetical protein EB824_04825 [Thaumarchaeota archaeon S15]|nr:MAG: hypothetical protein EB824_04825 [Thaumarchaeota archaeon S15]
MGARQEQAVEEGRSALARNGAPHAPCGIELDRDAGLAEDDGQGRSPAMPDMRDLREHAKAPLAGHGYRQEGILAPLEPTRLPMPEPAYRPGGAVALDLSGAARGGQAPQIKATYVPPNWKLLRAELIGRLVQFVNYAVENGVLEDTGAPDTFIGRHVIQKHVYIAQELGLGIGYKFEFLKNGAYSPSMAIDMYELDLAVIGPVAFDPEPMASRTFVDLVRGRSPEWLQVATFAVRDYEVSKARESFLSDRYRHLEYDRRLVDNVFTEVGSRMKQLNEGIA